MNIDADFLKNLVQNDYICYICSNHKSYVIIEPTEKFIIEFRDNATHYEFIFKLESKQGYILDFVALSENGRPTIEKLIQAEESVCVVSSELNFRKCNAYHYDENGWREYSKIMKEFSLIDINDIL